MLKVLCRRIPHRYVGQASVTLASVINSTEIGYVLSTGSGWKGILYSTVELYNHTHEKFICPTMAAATAELYTRAKERGWYIIDEM